MWLAYQLPLADDEVEVVWHVRDDHVRFLRRGMTFYHVRVMEKKPCDIRRRF